MGGSKSLQLPATPQYYENSNLGPNIDYGSSYNKGLLSGDFTGDRSWLSSLVNPNNSANALSYAQGLLGPQFRNNIQDITNQAVANNQNTSSTFTDSLAKASGDTNSAYQAILAQQAINDANQANANKLNILGMGESGLQGFTGLAQNETNSKNQFNLENYNNQVAAAIAGQKQQSGGFGGALMGGLGGAALGIGLAPFTGGLSLGLTAALAGGGALAGGLSPQSSNTGGNLLSAGAGVYGSRIGAAAPFAGSYASSNPYSNSNSNFGLNSANSSVSDILNGLRR